MSGAKREVQCSNGGLGFQAPGRRTRRHFHESLRNRGREPWDEPEHAPGEHDALSRSYVANLRAVLGRAPDDPEARALVDALLEGSPEFAALWAEHEVAVRSGQRKTIVHPTVGTMALDCQVLTAENLTECLVVFTAAPGSDAAERLKLLAVVGDASFAAG